MKWAEAVKIWNAHLKSVNVSHVYCLPKKGTPEHEHVKHIQKGGDPKTFPLKKFEFKKQEEKPKKPFKFKTQEEKPKRKFQFNMPKPELKIRVPKERPGLNLAYTHPVLGFQMRIPPGIRPRPPTAPPPAHFASLYPKDDME